MTAAGGLRVHVLGPVELTAGGQPVNIGGPQRRAVLALLVLGSGRVVHVDRILTAIWGEKPPRSALTKVQGHVCALRKALDAAGMSPAGNVLVTKPPGYLLLTDSYSCDLTEFTTQVGAAKVLTGRGDVTSACAVLDGALRSWRGPAFADLPYDGIRQHATHVDELRSIAMADKARMDLHLGYLWPVVEQLVPEVSMSPLNERTREILIEAYLRLGQRHAALACYQDGCAQLRSQLDIGPGPRLRRLGQLIRSGEPAPSLS